MTEAIDQLAFALFWKIYPRRVAKLDAMKAFDKALKIASADDILAGARRYASVTRDPQFTKHPASWLRTGCWMDEPEPARAPARGLEGLAQDLRRRIDDEQGQAGARSDYPEADRRLAQLGIARHSRPN